MTSDDDLLKRVDLPPPSSDKSWASTVIDQLNLPFVLILVISAWSFGGYMTANSTIQSQMARIQAQGERISDLQKELNQQAVWLREIQQQQAKANLETAEFLAKINLQLAEIKGASQKSGRVK